MDCADVAMILESYYDISVRKRKETFRDFTAQIIQHEMDHFEGKLI